MFFQRSDFSGRSWTKIQVKYKWSHKFMGKNDVDQLKLKQKTTALFASGIRRWVQDLQSVGKERTTVKDVEIYL